MNTDDRRLIAECLRGRQTGRHASAGHAAYGELVRRYQDRLYNAILRTVDGHSDDAQDVVQEAFLNAYQNLEMFKGTSEFFTWLYRIAFNSAISLRRKRRATLSLDPGSAAELNLEPVDTSEMNQPGDSLERAEEEAKLQAALNKLSPEHRIVLVLKDIEDQKYEEIAAVLQVPIGTVRSRLHRARLELRDILQQSE